MISGLAKIQVQKSFCDSCAEQIREELLKIKDITNVYFFPDEPLVIFNFIKANELSMALNALTTLGYPPKGDKLKKGQFLAKSCGCEHTNLASA